MRAARENGDFRPGGSLRADLMRAMRRASVWPRAMRIALQFLTCLPLRVEPPPEAREIGLSLACYPIVGLGLGVGLWASALAALTAHSFGAPWGDSHLSAGCILPPLLARAAIPVLFAHTPYVRAQGIARDLSSHQSRGMGCLIAASSALGALAVWRTPAALALGAAALTYFLIRTGLVR